MQGVVQISFFSIYAIALHMIPFPAPITRDAGFFFCNGVDP